MGIFESSKELAQEYANQQYRQLAARGRPNTKVDSGGTRNTYSFDGQEISRDELREVRDMREGGGIVSHLVHAKAMMQFGPGAEFQAEEDEAAEWLHEQFNNLDNLLIDIGEDATWFPYSLAEIVETQGGDFSHIELVEPWTTLPVENEVGEVITWEQQIRGDYSSTTETFEPDEIASFVLNKSSGRDKTGVSEVLRAEDEIAHFKENQKVMNDALEYLVPHHHWIIGSEGQSVINDNELHRFRNRIDNLKGDTQIISGPGVKHEQIDLPKFDIKEITNNDLRQLCVALGVPIELASVISEGLGSGEQSSARQVFFDLEKDAKQRALGGQFVEEIARILLRDYSEFDEDQQLDLVFRDARTPEEKKKTVDAIGDTLSNNERRELFDYAKLDDEEEGEAFQPPGQEEEGGLPGGAGGGGFFSDGRLLAQVPDNATSIDSPDECDGNVIEGPQGGMYCVPSDSGDGGDDTEPDSEIVEDLPDEYSGDYQERKEIKNSAAELVENGASYTEAVSTIEESVSGLDERAMKEIRQQAYINRSNEMEIAGDSVPVSPIIRTSYSQDDSPIREASKEELETRLPEGEGGVDRLQSMGNDWREAQINLLNTGTASIWATISENTGNDNFPDEAPISSPTADSFEQEIIEEQKQYTEDTLREMFGDTVPLSRGIDGEFAQQIQEAAESGEEIELEARAVESWTTFPDHAEQFATMETGDGVIITQEVPVEEIWASSHTTPGLAEEENEFLVGKEDSFSIDPENVHQPTDEELSEIYDVAAERGT